MPPIIIRNDGFDGLRAYQRKYYAEHKAKIQEKARTYYRQHREQILARQKLQKANQRRSKE